MIKQVESNNKGSRKNNQIEEGKVVSSGLNKVLWVVGLLLLIVVSFGGTYSKNFITNNIVRNISIFVLFCVALGILALTTQGKKVINFWQESKVELKKIIWPTIAETNQTSLIVMALALLSSLIIWGFDSVIYSFVNFVINLG